MWYLFKNILRMPGALALFLFCDLKLWLNIMFMRWHMMHAFRNSTNPPPSSSNWEILITVFLEWHRSIMDIKELYIWGFSTISSMFQACLCVFVCVCRDGSSAHHADCRALVHTGIHQLPSHWDHPLPWELWPQGDAKAAGQLLLLGRDGEAYQGRPKMSRKKFLPCLTFCQKSKINRVIKMS